MAPTRRPLGNRFFARDTATVARELIGCTLWSESGGEVCAGRIVECEAYLDERDPASHAGRGPTVRSAVMFGPPGVAYVYLIYGLHHCLNVVTEPDGRAGAVLLRAVEPLAGLPAMKRRRPGADARALCRGPGRLCRAFGIDLAWNGRPLGVAAAGRRVWIARGPSPGRVAVGVRIGVRRAADAPLRFCDQDSPWLSAPPGAVNF